MMDVSELLVKWLIPAPVNSRNMKMVCHCCGVERVLAWERITSLIPWAAWRWRVHRGGVEGGGRERRTVREDSTCTRTERRGKSGRRKTRKPGRSERERVCGVWWCGVVCGVVWWCVCVCVLKKKGRLKGKGREGENNFPFLSWDIT